MTSSEPPKYANRHVAKFLDLAENARDIQVLSKGNLLTAQALLDGTVSLKRPILVTDTPKSIGMKVLSPKKSSAYQQQPVSVRDVADVVGYDFPVHVIDVEHQEELDNWLLQDLVEYFEDDQRQKSQQQDATAAPLASTRSGRSRKASEKLRQSLQASASRRRVLNQISLEFSKTKLASKIRSPAFVRALDWIDTAWPESPKDRTEDSIYPNVQYYCLTSAAGCFTDFHLDFGGTSVWYHVMTGSKVFCLIRPTPEAYQVYEEWLCHKDQAALFLPDMIENKTDIFRLTLQESQTMIIPSGWIHAVFTPHDSVVLGGNFLHGLDVRNQVMVFDIEERTHVTEKFRFPFYVPLNFYAACMYYQKMRQGSISKLELKECPHLVQALEVWWSNDAMKGSRPKHGPSMVDAGAFAANKCGFDDVESFLQAMSQEITRLEETGIQPHPEYKVPLRSEKGPTSGTIKLRLKVSPTNTNDHPPVKSPRLRITLSEGATKLSAPVPTSVLPRKKAAPKEDTEWYEEASGRAAEDDDWVPSKKRSRPNTARPKEMAKPKSSQRSSSSTSSSRQRLLKRFR